MTACLVLTHITTKYSAPFFNFSAKNDLKGYISSKIGNLNHLMIFDAGTLSGYRVAWILVVVGNYFDDDLTHTFANHDLRCHS